jgi:plasmid stabilization system protein ParE
LTRVVIEPVALRDIEAQIDYLTERAPGAAEKAFDRLFGTIRALGEFPEIGPRVEHDHREMVVRFGHYGFIVRYRIAEDAVVIRRVFHGAQSR